MTASVEPPEVAAWNLALRFLLELAALGGVGVAAWEILPGALGWIGSVVVPVALATVWATFNVVEDPSRSGAAPVEVPGRLRLVLEVVLLLAGAAGYAVAGVPVVAGVVAALVVLHYATTVPRIRWLLAS